jgi:rhomboid protease GluP
VELALPPRWQWKLDRWREQFAGMFGGEREEGRPKLCPACGTLVGTTAKKCHECGASLTFSLAAVSRAFGGILPEGTQVTYVIMVANGTLFLMSLVLTLRVAESFSLFGGIDGMVLMRMGARQSFLILNGEVWRLVVPIFLHGGIFHIFMNSMVLMDLGPQLEELYGAARYFFLYIACGIFSFVVSTVWNIYTAGGYGLAIGASGALTGLIGLMLAITTRRGSNIMMQMYRKQLIKWIVYIGIFGLLLPGIDNAAHLGGLIAGFLLGKVFADREPANKQERARAYALGWLTLFVVVGSFAAMLVQYFRVT